MGICSEMLMGGGTGPSFMESDDDVLRVHVWPRDGL